MVPRAGLRLLQISVLLGTSLVGLSACEPTCKRTCRKIVNCSEQLDSERVTVEECEAACVFQERELEETEQDGLRNQLADHKRCIRTESCEDLAAGVCLDPDLAQF